MFRLLKDRRGLGSVVGSIFIILITIFSFNAIYWVILQQNSYREVTDQMSSFDTERFSENLEFASSPVVNFTSVGGGIYEFNLNISNVGGISLEIVRIYIYRDNNSTLTILDKQEQATDLGFSNGFFNSGEVNSTVHVRANRNLNDGNIYTIKLVTERGRIFSTQYRLTSASQSTVGEFTVGALKLDLVYNSVNYTSPTQHTPVPGWIVPGSTNLVFYIELTNTGAQQIKILKSSVFYAMEFKESGNPVPKPFFIVGPTTNYPGGTPGVVAYDEVSNPYIIPPNSSVIVKFSSGTVGGSSPNQLGGGTRYLAFIGLYYEMGGQERGLNIPFVAIRTS